MKYTGDKNMEIEYTKQAVKQISRFDKSTKKRLKEAIERIPQGDIKRLQGVTPTTFRLRVGDLRVLFEMTSQKIIIRNILPRGEAYNRL